MMEKGAGNIGIVVRGHDGVETYAEAEDPEQAVFAAVTMLREEWESHRTQGYDPSATFYVAGEPVRTATLRSLTRTV